MVNSITKLAYGTLNNTLKSVKVAGAQLSSGNKYVGGFVGNSSNFGIGLDNRGRGAVLTSISESLNTNQQREITASEYLSASGEILTRMQELAAISLDSSISSGERTALDGEFDVLVANLQDISTTTYNGVAFLQAATAAQTVYVGTNETMTIAAIKHDTWSGAMTNNGIDTVGNASTFIDAADGLAASLAVLLSKVNSSIDQMSLFSRTNSQLGAAFENAGDVLLNVDVAKALAEYSSSSIAVNSAATIVAKGVSIDQISASLYNQL